MDSINYPLLRYKLSENATLGILVGTDLQAVDKDAKAVKKQLHNHLVKQYKKFDDYPYFDIEQPKMRMVDLKVRPTYTAEHGAFPTDFEVKLPMPIIFGENDQGYFECYLPLLEKSFHYYEEKQLMPLLKNFTTNLMTAYSPDEIFRMQTYPTPELEILSLKVNYDREFDWDTVHRKREFKHLQRIAEQFPAPKALKKAGQTLPETAWEMEDKVNLIIENMIMANANILVVGKSGVGKSAVIRQAIKKVVSQSKKTGLTHSFWRVMAQRITASAKYLGEWQEAVELMINELDVANGILWVEDPVELLKTGGGGAEDSVAAFLLGFLLQNKLQLIGEATPEELESIRRLLPGFAESFQIIYLEDLAEPKIQSILNKFAEYAAQTHKVRIGDEAQQQAYRLLHRFYPYEQFPGKGIKFLGQCVSNALVSNEREVTKHQVIDNFIQQTGLPELFLRDEWILDSAQLEGYFSNKIIGQPTAINQLTSIVKIFKAGLNNPNKPITTLLFAGPTGVGKTASAKALAEYFFGEGNAKLPLVRIDMSEFQHPMMITRLIGEGKEPGQLVKEIRDKPFSVLLLDEVEKADKSIFDALLTVLDEGIMVDAFGRITNFRNTIIIMTSNLGASNQNSIGFTESTDLQATYESAIKRFFRPEFVNRIDTIVMFNPLAKTDIQAITIKELMDLKKREGFVKRGLELTYTQPLINHLSDAGFDEKYGARPLQRAIENSLISPMAHWMLEHESLRDVRLELDWDGALRIRVL